MVKKKNRRGIREQALDAPADVKRSGINLRQLQTPEPEPEPEVSREPPKRYISADAELHIDLGGPDESRTVVLGPSNLSGRFAVNVRANQRTLSNLATSVENFRQSLRVNPNFLTLNALDSGAVPSLREELEQMAQRAATTSARQIIETSRRLTVDEWRRALRGDEGATTGTQPTAGGDQQVFEEFQANILRRLEEKGASVRSCTLEHEDSYDGQTGRRLGVTFAPRATSARAIPACAIAMVAHIMANSETVNRMARAIRDRQQSMQLRLQLLDIAIWEESYTFIMIEHGRTFVFDVQGEWITSGTMPPRPSKADLFTLVGALGGFR